MIDKPLAFRMRPETLDQVIGQTKLVSFLTKLKETNSLLSMVFYGPPGTGKTTIARAFAKSMNVYSVSLNAVIDNKATMEAAFNEAIRFNPSIVIIDEIRRLDKSKQDLLLPHLENGDFFLIGCTTANPLISLNPAIRSRTRLLETESLSPKEIKTGLLRASQDPKGLDKKRQFEDGVFTYLAKIAGGDLRFAYNQLEAIALSYPSDHLITVAEAKEIATAPNYLADLNGDEHYDTVSALQKSIRGSEVDAAIYYLAKLLKSGDLEGLTRRLMVTAYEDVGLANPPAVDRCYNACQVALTVGLPEAQIPLAFSVVDLALSPKSKSACLAIEDAMASIDDSPVRVRDYLRLKRANVSEQDSYPYDDPDVWALLEYLPENAEDASFYRPRETGKYEKALKENYLLLKKTSRTSDMQKAKQLAAQNRKK
ncbi:MAG: AAA family ATPase [Bacilli bacterium]|jgi:putative ATPase|nr:AAA family ATPase [Bacilli bacterium]